jgi:hypothetical protein
MENKFERIQLDLPMNVEVYLKKHAKYLLESPAAYVLDVFNTIMGYELDREVEPIEFVVLEQLLRHFEEEKKGTKRGILGVIDGGLAKKKSPIEEMMEGPEIRGVIANIRIFTDIPEDEGVMKFRDLSGTVHHIKALADFIMDGRMILVGHHREEDCVTFFYVQYDENENAILDSVQDDEEFEFIGKVWEVLKEADFGEQQQTQLH